MARVRAHTLRPLATSDQPSLNRQLRRALARELARLQPAIARSAAACGAERYRKHFDSYAHTCLLLFHGLSGSPSLRQSYAAFGLCPGLVGVSGLGTADPDRLAVSFSHLADSNSTRPAAVLAGVIPGLVQRVRQAGLPLDERLPPELRALDATFLALSLKRCPWVRDAGGGHRPGLRLQVQYVPARDLPEHTVITTARINDRRALEQLLDDPIRLAALRDQTLTIDLGYYGHRHFARLLDGGVHFVSRLHPQARCTVSTPRPIQLALPAELPTGRITVTSDAVVTLGSPNNRAGTVLDDLRQVVAVVQPHPRARAGRTAPVTYVLITDRFDLAADEVVQLYVWRWEIEGFFRWLKRMLGLGLRKLGHSRNAVELSVWLALVVHLLLVLIRQALGSRQRATALLAQLRLVLGQVGARDVAGADLTALPQQLTLPGLAAAPT